MTDRRTYMYVYRHPDGPAMGTNMVGSIVMSVYSLVLLPIVQCAANFILLFQFVLFTLRGVGKPAAERFNVLMIDGVYILARGVDPYGTGGHVPTQY